MFGATIGTIILLTSYNIRTMAIDEFGPVIHEFDPYFNLRATEYLYAHGRKKFFQWFDYMSWYPLGRPVGTTIYPGLQFTAVWVKNHIVGDSMSLNDVCCYIPAWFGVVATFVTGLIAYESSLECNSSTNIFQVLMDIFVPKGDQSKNTEVAKHQSSSVPIFSFLCTMAAMAVMPAHLMRSVGGGFDNESIAISAMVMTFYFWVRSLRNGDDKSHWFGILTGVSYFYMVAVWGGYVFVLNMISLHAAILVVLGRFSTKLYLAFSIFYVVGTSLAIQVPVVGWTPLKSLEQLGCCAVFLGFQVLQFCEVTIKKKGMSRADAWKFRIKIVGAAAVIGIAALAVFIPSGYFGPISSRVRGLFVKHTRTGNPLVDSVAEHQPAQAGAYSQYLKHFAKIAPVGLIMTLFKFGDSSSFAVAYGITTYFFSHKMVRLILLMAPAASILGGIALGRSCAWALDQFWTDAPIPKNKPSKKKKSKKNGKSADVSVDKHDFMKKTAKRVFACFLLFGTVGTFRSYNAYSWAIGKHLSNPSIIQVGQRKDGSIVKVDDYREAYNWIRRNTPENARVMAWWDYGYQITSIANRTTIADGNTWNHEHIALLAKILTGPLEEGYEIARHLADYILVWSGGNGDDVDKSPHLARIANSVYRDMCNDPVCSQFGFMRGRDGRREPTPQMMNSLVFNLVRMELSQDHTKMFKEVYSTKYRKVRIYKILGVDKESKAWVADPDNRVCDVKGGWYCRGQYPPALDKILKVKKDFVQLEDFNKKDHDAEYQQKYFESMNDMQAKKKKQQDAMRARMKEL